MASFAFLAGIDPFATSIQFSSPEEWTFVSLSSTKAVWESADYRIELLGTGFAGGAAPAGTITGIRVYELDHTTGSPVSQLIAQNTSALSLSFAGLVEALSEPSGFYFALPAYILQGNDSVTGSAASDELIGYAGNDTLVGNAGDDFLQGDSYEQGFVGGNDSLLGGAGVDLLDGGAGIDTMRGGTDSDEYVVGSAGDTVIENAGEGNHDRVVFANDGGLTTYTLPTNVEHLQVEHVSGTGVLSGRGNELANKISVTPTFGFGDPNEGREALYGLGGNDRLFAANGNDTLDGGTGIDTMIGGTGNDVYVVDHASDVVIEDVAVQAGTDAVQSSVSWTLGTNIERLTLAGSGAINGTGNALSNLLTGNAANNSLAGGTGNDTLNGGAGNDTLNGGSGIDTFRFANALSATTNVDAISGFVAADDRIELENAIFTQVGAVGALAAGAFRAGAAAADADDRIIYNSATGQLRYDADGSGAGASVLFATVTAGTVVTAADFFVI